MPKKGKFKIGICDDHTEEVDNIIELIKTYPKFSEADICVYKPHEIIFDLEEDFFNCDIIIMDIYYDNIEFNGIDVAHIINEKYPHSGIVFVSDYIVYAERVYETKHSYFIQKKNMKFFLERALQKCTIQAAAEKNKQVMEIYTNRIKHFVSISDIYYIEKRDRHAVFHTVSGEMNSIKSLKQILKSDESEKLCKIHESYIINLEQIRRIENKSVMLKDGTTLPVTYSFHHDFREKYARYHSRLL